MICKLNQIELLYRSYQTHSGVLKIVLITLTVSASNKYTF